MAAGLRPAYESEQEGTEHGGKQAHGVGGLIVARAWHCGHAVGPAGYPRQAQIPRERHCGGDQAQHRRAEEVAAPRPARSG